jgi:hypothetical protein
VARAEPERAHDPAAEKLLRHVESEYRRLPRCVQLRISTRFDSTLRSERTLWSAVDGDTVTTRVLYVFTKPEDLRGMSLLVHDHVDPSRADSTWLYLPAYRDFSRLDAPSQKVMVPGTALTNDDARGFIPAERYALQFADSAGARIVVARPHNVRMRLLTGYDRLRIRIDPRRHLVEQVDFTGTDGRPLKTYELLDAVEVQGVWLPRRVRIRHLQLGFDSLVEYTYRPFTPPVALFTPSVARETFLPRMERALARLGIGIDAAAP